MFSSIDRVYINQRARDELRWKPRHNFENVIERVYEGLSIKSRLAELVGIKDYHSLKFEDGPYPVDK
jgi:hypothetical protein